MGGHRQPVGARCRHALADQRPDDFVEQDAPHLDEDQHVAGTHRPAARPERTLSRDPDLDLAGDAFRHPALRGLVHRIGRHGRPLVGIRFVRDILDRRPQRHHAAAFGARRFVRQAVLLQRSGLEVRPLEHFIDGVQHFGKSAKTVFQRDAVHFEIHRLGAEGVFAPSVDEHFGISALERKDRLLLVADGEHRAGPVGGARTEEEVVDQRPDHLPLLRVGVLAFIDEDVADAGIELVTHPEALGVVLQQRRQFFDEVVEIQQRAGALARLVVLGNRGDHIKHRLAARHQFGGGEAGVQTLQTPRLGGEARGNVRDQHRQRLFQQRLARRMLQRQERVEQRIRVGPVRVDLAQPVDEIGAVGIGPHQRENRRMIAAVEAIAAGDLLEHLVDTAHLADQLAQFPLGEPGLRQHAAQRPLLVQRLDDRGLDLEIAQQTEQRLDRARLAAAAQARRQHRLAGFEQHAVALVLLEHAEIERHSGLAREAVQHALAEGVDGLDAQTPRRFQRMGKERAGPEPHARRRRGTAQRHEVAFELKIARQRPFSQPLGDAAAHLGRRRLGVGEAENFLRLHPAQQ